MKTDQQIIAANHAEAKALIDRARVMSAITAEQATELAGAIGQKSVGYIRSQLRAAIGNESTCARVFGEPTTTSAPVVVAGTPGEPTFKNDVQRKAYDEARAERAQRVEAQRVADEPSADERAIAQQMGVDVSSIVEARTQAPSAPAPRTDGLTPEDLAAAHTMGIAIEDLAKAKTEMNTERAARRG